MNKDTLEKLKRVTKIFKDSISEEGHCGHFLCCCGPRV